MRIRDMVKEAYLLTYAHVLDKAFRVRTAIVKFFDPTALVIRGDWYMTLKDENGKVKMRRWLPCNLVVTAGKNHLANHLAAVATAYPMKYLGIGVGTTAAAAGDTALETECTGENNYSRVTGTQSNPSGAIYQVVGTFGVNNPSTSATKAITEAGLLSATSAGTMLNRQVFSAINKAPADSLEITMQVTFS